uniref:Uncharacterized protein n=1 Tax=Vespula pensylvanica TaxID=30213 RepID=A0A834P3Y7_VESPE|nr:hypothetical protein H0235_007057 [Vespula pensylvanica]
MIILIPFEIRRIGRLCRLLIEIPHRIAEDRKGKKRLDKRQAVWQGKAREDKDWKDFKDGTERGSEMVRATAASLSATHAGGEHGRFVVRALRSHVRRPGAAETGETFREPN